jgi:hypothetical protein
VRGAALTRCGAIAAGHIAQVEVSVMPIPNEILRHAEAHACFSGCYALGNDMLCLVDSSLALAPAIDVQCQDCLTFRLGALVSQLGKGTDRYRLARELTAHVAASRGYTLSLAGYHTQGGGFWLSAAYWSRIGVFVLKSDRGQTRSSDLDLLIKAFATGVAKPLDQAMLDASQYATQRVLLNVTQTAPPTSLSGLLSSPAVGSRAPGFVEVTLAEYLPVARTANSTPVGSVVAGPAAKAPPKLGERCSACGEIVSEHALLTSVYVGCGCR